MPYILILKANYQKNKTDYYRYFDTIPVIKWQWNTMLTF